MDKESSRCLAEPSQPSDPAVKEKEKDKERGRRIGWIDVKE